MKFTYRQQRDLSTAVTAVLGLLGLGAVIVAFVWAVASGSIDLQGLGQ